MSKYTPVDKKWMSKKNKEGIKYEDLVKKKYLWEIIWSSEKIKRIEVKQYNPKVWVNSWVHLVKSGNAISMESLFTSERAAYRYIIKTRFSRIRSYMKGLNSYVNALQSKIMKKI